MLTKDIVSAMLGSVTITHAGGSETQVGLQLPPGSPHVVTMGKKTVKYSAMLVNHLTGMMAGNFRRFWGHVREAPTREKKFGIPATANSLKDINIQELHDLCEAAKAALGVVPPSCATTTTSTPTEELRQLVNIITSIEELKDATTSARLNDKMVACRTTEFAGT